VEEKKYNLTVSVSPHIHAPDSTRSIMLDVIIALMPALIGSIYFFGLRALVVCAVSVGACIFFEWGYRKLMKKDITIGDLSAVVTGLLLAFVCPVTIPYWALIIGDFFAIIVVKQLFGGIGQNFMNPALAARAFLFSWPVLMTTWVAPGTALSILGSNVDAVTAATPLASLKSGVLPSVSMFRMYVGSIGGCLGETSTVLLLLGGVYLYMRDVISARIPVAFLGTVAVLTFLFPQGGNDRVSWMLYELCSGGLVLGAVFMATDYTTSPVTKAGQVVYGIGCGLLTVFIRYFGSYAEGVSYAILIMNVCVGFLDRVGVPKRFGLVKEKKSKEGDAQ
jgi:electron transport complex protein RnfD